MREPRPQQRFPNGGKELYELLRMDHEPAIIFVYPRGLMPKERERMPDTLTYEPDHDPMVYFWPVEGHHVLVCLDTQASPLPAKPARSTLNRLARAMMRDGAIWVTVLWNKKTTSEGESRLDLINYGDPEGYIRDRHPGPERLSS